MNYLSICSGIEAASVAWHPLGWKAVAFAEIDAFPSAVLKHRWPSVRNLGDFTHIKADDVGPVDLLVGGTPCQSFSIAGLRGGLADDRGNLALQFLKLAQRTRPSWLVWENVPGVLSSDGGRDFGAILGGMVECGYGFAYRVLDAQYFGLAQRRKRVFVIGYLGDWRPAAAVLFERESLSGHPAPSRKARKDVAGTLGSRSTAGGGLGTDFDLDGGLQAFTASSHGNYREGVGTLRANGGDIGDGSETLVAMTLNAKGGAGRIDAESETFITHALRAEGFDASEDGTGRGTPLIPVSFVFQPNDPGMHNERNVSPTLRGGSGGGSLGTTTCVAFHENQRGELTVNHTAGSLNVGGGKPGQGYPAVSVGAAVRRLTPRECERLQGFPDDYTLITYRSKPAADGPRYRALGNSMAVPVMRWIGERIAAVESMAAEVAA